MTQKQESENSLPPQYQNIDEYSESCINFFSSIIDKDNLNLDEITKIIQIISNSLDLGYVKDSVSEKIVKILSSSTNLISYSFQKKYFKLFPSLDSVLNPKKSFYINNSKNIIPSYSWSIVIDNFIQSNGIESILKYLEIKEELSCNHFILCGKILNNVSSRMENTKYQIILKRATNSLMNFLIETKKYKLDQFAKLYSQYFHLCSKTLLEPNDFSAFLSILNYGFKEPKLHNFGCKQLLALLETPAKSLIINQDYCDFILSLNLNETNTKNLSPIYILFSQNDLFDFSKLEKLNNQRKTLIIDCIAEYIDLGLLKSFTEKIDIDDVNLSIFIQFLNNSNEEPLVKSTTQKILSFGDNENNQKIVYDKFLLLLSNNKILPTIFEEISLFQPTCKTSLCSDLIEQIRMKILGDGNYFISHFRNTKSITQLQQLIETISCENKNQSVFDEYEKCHAFEILCSNITNNRFGSEGICSMLSLFKAFSSYILPMLNKLIPNLLKIFSIRDENDKLFLTTVSLLNELYDLSPDESLQIIEINLKELSQAIQNVPDSAFANLKEFIINLDDRLFFALFTFAKNNEKHFFDIFKDLEVEMNKQNNLIEYIRKSLTILNQLDDTSFDKLFNEFLSKLNQKVLDENEFIMNDLLDIALNTHSEKILLIIFDKFDFLSSLSRSASRSIDDFKTKLSLIKLDNYNISQLELEHSHSGLKILVSDRSDIDSVLQVLYLSFPFNFMAVSSNELIYYADSISKIQFLFQEMNLCEQKYINSKDVTNYFAKLQKEPADFYDNLTKICPDKWKDEFQFKLKYLVENNSKSIEEGFCLLTVPVDGFKSLNEAIIDLFNNTENKKEIIKNPPVLVIQLKQNENEIEIPIHLDINQLINKYDLTASVIFNTETNEFNSLVKSKDNWILFTDKEIILINNEIDKLLKNSHLVFYTQQGSSVDEIINDNLTTLYIEYPFNLNEYINRSASEKISKKNELFRTQYSVLNETTIKFMIDKSQPIILLRYFIHSICHSAQFQYVEISTEKLIKFLSGDEIVNYVESDFDNFIDSLSKSPYSNQIIKIINHAINNCSSETLLIDLMHHFLNQLKNIVCCELTPISQILFEYVSSSEENVQIARQNKWHQELITIIVSVFNFNKEYQYLRNLDLSPLFNTLSILISKDFMPNDVYKLYNISEQALISEKHDQSYVSFLFKLNSLKVFQTELDASKISYINSFQTIINKNEVPAIPSIFNASNIFAEIQSQIESGNETLRSNMLKVYLPKLISYLEDENEKVRNAAQNLIYVLCGYPSKSIYDQVIRELLSSLPKASDCSTILEVSYNLIDKSKYLEDDYLQAVLDCSQNLQASKDINQSLISFYQLFETQKVSPKLTNVVESIDGDYENLIDYLNEFKNDPIIDTLSLPKWKEIMKSVDNEHKVSIIQKLLNTDNKEADQFIANSIIEDQSLTLLNSFLAKAINNFQPSETVELFNMLNYMIKKSNDTIPETETNKFYLDSIVNFSDAVVPSSVDLPPEIELDFNEMVKFFDNFWPGLPSEKLLLLLNKIAGENSDFLKNLRNDLLKEMSNQVEPNEPEKWHLAIVCSDVMLNNREKLFLGDDNDLTNEMKKIYDQSCLQHSKVANANPHLLFDYYISKLIESPKSTWIPLFASKLYPEAKFSSDEEKEFYRLALSENPEQLALEKAKEIEIAKEKARAEQIAKEKARAEQLALQKEKEEQLAKEKARAEQLALQKEKEEQLAKEKARAEQLALEKEKEEQLAKEKARAEQLVLEKEEQLAKEKARAEQLALQKEKEEQIENMKDRTEEFLNEKDKHNGDHIDSDKSKTEQFSSDKTEPFSFDNSSKETPTFSIDNSNEDISSIKDRSIEIIEEEEEVDDESGNENDNNNKVVTERSPVRGLSDGSTPLSYEQRKLNSLLYGEEEEEQIDQRDGFGDFSLDEFSNDLAELEQPSEAATATATAVGTAALTTVSYLLYKYMKRRK